jgi:hypothetical protein
MKLAYTYKGDNLGDNLAIDQIEGVVGMPLPFTKITIEYIII